jgi:hypothetical protein
MQDDGFGRQVERKLHRIKFGAKFSATPAEQSLHASGSNCCFLPWT